MSAVSILVIVLPAIGAYLIGRAQGFASAIKWLATFQADEVDPHVITQRENANWQ